MRRRRNRGSASAADSAFRRRSSASLGQTRDRGGGELRLLGDSGRRCDGRPGSHGLEQEPFRAGRAPTRRWPPRRATRRAPTRSRPERTRTRSRRPSGIAGRTESGFVRSRMISQSGSSRSERSAARATGSEAEWSSTTISCRFSPGLEEVEIDARRDHPVVAREALGGGRGSLLRGGDQRVDPAEQLVAERPARGVGEALGREERRDGQRLRVAERQVGDARQRGLEAVDDVVLALAERQRDVGAHADRHAEARPARDGHARPDGDHVRRLAAVQGPPAGEEVGCSARGGEDGDRVAEGAERSRHSGDMLVDLVRLRPGERGHEADAKAHPSSVALRPRGGRPPRAQPPAPTA